MSLAGGSGRVFLVGAGPGAPDLLTLRAARLLGDADIVFHDALVHPDTLALAGRARLVGVGKRCGHHSSSQVFINHSLVEAARHHQVVVRLKGGDPLVFGRAQEEIDALVAAGIDYEVVPGVTAALGAAADLGVSLTRRGLSRSLALVTPRIGVEEADGHGWIDCARHADTVAIYMAREDATAVATALMMAGRSPATPVTLVVNTPATSLARNHPTESGPGRKLIFGSGLTLALLLLPLSGRMRRSGRKLARVLVVLAAMAAGVVAISGLSGCNGYPTGFFGQSPQTYTITVTGTSGPLSHSTSVTLTIN